MTRWHYLIYSTWLAIDTLLLCVMDSCRLLVTCESGSDTVHYTHINVYVLSTEFRRTFYNQPTQKSSTHFRNIYRAGDITGKKYAELKSNRTQDGETREVDKTWIMQIIIANVGSKFQNKPDLQLKNVILACFFL